MGELLVLISEYMAFRAARGFQPNRKTERLLTQFVGSLPAERDDGLLFSQGEALAWAHASVGGRPAWLSARLSTVRQFSNLSRRLRPASRRARNPPRSQRKPPSYPVSVLDRQHPGSYEGG
jgi:hypothetical protein